MSYYVHCRHIGKILQSGCNDIQFSELTSEAYLTFSVNNDRKKIFLNIAYDIT